MPRRLPHARLDLRLRLLDLLERQALRLGGQLLFEEPVHPESALILHLLRREISFHKHHLGRVHVRHLLRGHI